MDIYHLPSIDDKIKNKIVKIAKNRGIWLGFLLIVAFITFGFSSGVFSLSKIQDQLGLFLQKIEAPATSNEKPAETAYKSNISYEQAIIDSVKGASPSVVSIIISKNLPVYEKYFINPFPDIAPGFDFQIPQYVQRGSKLQEVGAGSGFIVSEDGFILTNKHVVSDKQADYTVLTNDGQKYSAKVLALDPVKDLAIIKIQSDHKFPAIKLGDSSGAQIGQSVIAIGNALGEFSNTVSVGIISGLGRTISASDKKAGISETLEGIIQTDAAINSGNSGGPLLNLKGEVIGINTAMAEGAQSIGFAIPINTAKKDIEQVVEKSRLQSNRGSSTESGQIKIVYPFLGVRYVLVDTKVKEQYSLSTDYGALVLRGNNGEPFVVAGSAAAKAGIKEKDVILEFKSSAGSDQAWEKITKDNSMSKIITKYNPGDKITLKILRNGKEITLEVILGERTS
ncbi:MAG: trypsin-like peptidase domain-containing protein [Patescibacteria group bacterium]